ncbi:MAG: asparagine synthase C-terminal domain-containing protein [Candidatus Diapherotrites archaeon]
MKYGKLEQALENSVSSACAGKKAVNVLFSGGLDSSLIAFLASKHCITHLYVAGMPNCFDFAQAKKTAFEMDWHLHEIVIQKKEISKLKKDFERITKIKDNYNASLGIPILACAKHLQQKDVLSGLGADALFAGFSHTKRILEKEGEKDVEADLRVSIESAKKDFERDSRILKHFGKQLHAPFLDEKVIVEAFCIPAREKVKTPQDELRKWPLREIAKELKLPEMVWKAKKKALQYGSGVEKELRD